MLYLHCHCTMMYNCRAVHCLIGALYPTRYKAVGVQFPADAVFVCMSRVCYSPPGVEHRCKNHLYKSCD